MNNGVWRIVESFIVDGAMAGSALHRARILSCTNMQRSWAAGVRAWRDRSITRACLEKLRQATTWYHTDLSSMTLSTRAHWLVEAARVSQSTHMCGRATAAYLSVHHSAVRWEKTNTQKRWMCASQTFREGMALWHSRACKLICCLTKFLYNASIRVFRWKYVIYRWILFSLYLDLSMKFYRLCTMVRLSGLGQWL